jgi:hypothetical protein
MAQFINTLVSLLIATLINDGGSATFAQIVAVVEQKMKKTGNALRNCVITKRVNYNVLLNANYTNMVNNQLAREGKEADFQAKENWFKTIFDSFNGSIVCHKDDPTRLYLKFACNEAQTLCYFVDGVEATPEQVAIIKEFRQVSSTPTNQGTDKPIIIRTVKVENIKEVHANGLVVEF